MTGESRYRERISPRSLRIATETSNFETLPYSAPASIHLEFARIFLSFSSFFFHASRGGGEERLVPLSRLLSNALNTASPYEASVRSKEQFLTMDGGGRDFFEEKFSVRSLLSKGTLFFLPALFL